MAFADVEKKREYQNKWCIENRERINKRERERYKTNAEEERKRSKKKYNQEKHWARHLKRTFNLSVDDYTALLKQQDGKCAMCGTSNPGERKKHFAVDHCHKTGQIRGLLCTPCNTSLGIFEKYADACIKYLTNTAESKQME